MNYLLDECISIRVANSLKAIFNKKTNGVKIYHTYDRPFHKGIKDNAMFRIIAHKNDWCIITFDKFRPWKVLIKTLNIRVVNIANLKKADIADQAARLISNIHKGNSEFCTAKTGRMYLLRQGGTLKAQY